MRNAKGFTLIELMIVVAVIAILATFALPSYQEYVRKGRRAEAVRAIGVVQLGLERWRAENPSYAGCGATCTSTTPYYTITPSALGPGDYTLTAVPAGAQQGDRCGNLVAIRATNNGKPTWSTASCN
ncbi:type IV pilin protein [Lysobacter rhizosphaerae]